MDDKTWRAERKCRTRARAVSFYMRLVVPESYQLRGLASMGASGVPPRSTTGGARWRARSR